MAKRIFRPITLVVGAENLAKTLFIVYKFFILKNSLITLKTNIILVLSLILK